MSLEFLQSQFVTVDDKPRTPVSQGEKDFSCGGCSSAGKVSMECNLEKESYYHGENIPITLTVNNQSTKTIRLCSFT